MAKVSTCVATLFLLLASAATTTFGLRELEAIQAAQTQIEEARNWIQFRSAVNLNDENKPDLDHVAAALSDCDQLYDDSGSRLAELLDNMNHTNVDDARAWVSGVLTNHMTCLDGLDEQGLVGPYAMSQNLTSTLSEALALYAKKSKEKKSKGKKNKGIKKGGRGRPTPTDEQNVGGHLVSWSPATSRANFVVAQDGSGTHRRINDALAALGRNKLRTGRTIIYVKAGVYHEKVVIKKNMRNLMFVGDGMDRTVVTGSLNNAQASGTMNSATFGVFGDGFWARDMTFENTAGPGKEQAAALMVSADRCVFYRCSFKGYQDTLYPHGYRQFFRDCHIYGTVDMICGNSAVVFQNCDIFLRRPGLHDNTVTAQGRKNLNDNTAISIQGSRIRPSPELGADRGSFRSYLGRPWQPYSRTVIMQTDIDGLIDPKGWRRWNNKDDNKLSTLFFAEYRNTGAGASTANRVTWPTFHVFRSPQEAWPFTVSSLLQGDSWIPASGVPFQLGV